MKLLSKLFGTILNTIKTLVRWMLSIFAVAFVLGLAMTAWDSLIKPTLVGLSDTVPLITEMADFLPGIPSDLQDHYLLTYRGKGDCTELEGDVLVLTLFVTDPYSDWTEDQKQSVREDQTMGIADIRAEAARYGVEVNIQPIYMDVYAPNQTEEPRTKGIDMDSYAKAVLSAAGLPDKNSVIDRLKETYGMDEAVVMFYTDTTGTSEAFVVTSDSGFEHTFMFRDTAAFQHELYHVFGAKDFYTPQELKTLTKGIYGDSVMMSSSTSYTDSLTAYLIGWTDTPDSKALQLLRDSDHLTIDDYNDAKAERPWDGYATQTMDNGTYSGQYLNGVRNGQGTYIWNSGNVYEGHFENGVLSGYGTMRWANGDKYEGSWEKGVRSGYGTMQWANGNHYQGNWKDGSFHGHGTYKWANGTRYEGDFVDGSKQGYGIMTWANGESYKGDFYNDQRHGYGTYKWANGDRFEGNWQNGERTGYGTYYWANGKYSSGYWVNGKKQ